MLMEMCIKVLGVMEKQMGLECMCIIQMGLCTKAIGKTIFKKEMERRYGLMVRCMKEVFKQARSMVREHSNGTMDRISKENFMRTTSTEKANTPGQTVESTKANGKIT